MLHLLERNLRSLLRRRQESPLYWGVGLPVHRPMWGWGKVIPSGRSPHTASMATLQGLLPCPWPILLSVPPGALSSGESLSRSLWVVESWEPLGGREANYSRKKCLWGPLPALDSSLNSCPQPLRSHHSTADPTCSARPSLLANCCPSSTAQLLGDLPREASPSTGASEKSPGERE